MTTTIVEGALKRWCIRRDDILPDFIAVFTVSIAASEALEAAQTWLVEGKPNIQQKEDLS